MHNTFTPTQITPEKNHNSGTDLSLTNMLKNSHPKILTPCDFLGFVIHRDIFKNSNQQTKKITVARELSLVHMALGECERK